MTRVAVLPRAILPRAILAFVILPLVIAGASAASGQVVIHEIYYNQPGPLETTEFIELRNVGATPVDLEPLAFIDGVAFEFAGSGSLAPGAFALVVASRGAFLARYPGAPVAGEYVGVLANGGERLALADVSDPESPVVVDEVRYGDGEDWPPSADGDGASLELIKPSVDNDFPGNWAAGQAPTPGAPNRAAADRLEPVAWSVASSPRVVPSGNRVTVTARVFSEEPLARVLVRLDTGRGALADHAMRDDGEGGDLQAADGVFSATIEPLAGGMLAKYKVVLVEAGGAEREFPSGSDESDWYAWFVDDGADRAGSSSPVVRLFLSEEKLRILADNAQVRSAGDPRYARFDESFAGFAVFDGRVHRKVRIRHRGGFASRHAGRLKYSWRLAFPDWDRYQGRETVIIQGNMHWDDPWMRGDNGLQDKLCYLTFDRAGVPSSRTRFVRLVVNGAFFGWHVEVEAIDEHYLERNGFSGDGDLYKHGRTAQAHNFPLAPSAYATAYEKQTGDRGDFSSIREFCDDLAAAGGGGGGGNLRVIGRIWDRDAGTRPERATFVQSGLGEFDTARRSVGFLAYRSTAEFDNVCITGGDGARCAVANEDGESIADWTLVEGSWTAAGGAVRFAGPAAAVHHRIARAGALEFADGPVTVSFDVRITSPQTGDNWAGVALFLGGAPDHGFTGSLCAALRFRDGGSEGLHLVNAGVRWIQESGQFDWTVGRWYRVEYVADTVDGGESGVGRFFAERTQIDAYRRYLAGIILSTHWDSTNQNYFFYRDELADGRWIRFPWDMDITWGYSRRQRPPAQGHNLHPYDGTPFKPVPNEYGTSALRQAFLGDPELRASLHDTLADAIGTWFTEREIQPVIARILDDYGAEAQEDVEKWNRLDGTWDWLPFAFHARYDSVYVSSRRKYLAEFLDRAPILSQAAVVNAAAGPLDALTFEVNALGTRYDGTYDLGASNLAAVDLHLLVDGVESEHTMAAVDPRVHDFYRVTVPAILRATRVFYRFSARDDRGRDGVLPVVERDGHEWFAFDVATEAAAPGDVVISELMYRARYYDVEFVELRNTLWRALDLSGWRLHGTRDDVDYVFPPGTTIAPGAYLVLSRDTRAVFEFYGVVELAANDLPFSLSNAGDELTLFDDASTRIDTVVYLDTQPWPEAADGGGPSLELVDARSDNEDPASWSASLGQGTPGRANSVSPRAVPPQPGDSVRVRFQRGDVDQNGLLELTDAVAILARLFLGADAPACVESADTNNDGILDLTDGVVILTYLFAGGTPPAAPGPPPEGCGVDPDEEGTARDLGCAAYQPCDS